MVIRPSPSSCNYAKSQDSLVTTTPEDCQMLSQILRLISLALLPSTSGRWLGVLACVRYLQFSRQFPIFLPDVTMSLILASCDEGWGSPLGDGMRRC